LNCAVPAADEGHLLNTLQITLDVLLDCPERPGLAGQSVVTLQDLAVPDLGTFRLWQCCDDRPLPSPDEEFCHATTVHEIAQVAEVPNHSG
jgi:hypothetical protein